MTEMILIRYVDGDPDFPEWCEEGILFAVDSRKNAFNIVQALNEVEIKNNFLNISDIEDEMAAGILFSVFNKTRIHFTLGEPCFSYQVVPFVTFFDKDDDNEGSENERD